MTKQDAPPSSDELVAQIEALATKLLADPPVTPHGAAELVALVPAEPVVGPVAVAIWTTSDESSLYELVRLDGTRLDDSRALREAFVLLAMNEALEEQLDPLRIREVLDALVEWQAIAAGAGDAVVAGDLRDAVGTAIWPAVEQLQLVEQAVGDPAQDVTLARASRLDELGGALRALETAWLPLEAAAGAWADATMNAAASTEADAKLVEQLWNALAAARRGPLAQPASTVLEAGRAAGAALADEVLGAKRAAAVTAGEDGE